MQKITYIAFILFHLSITIAMIFSYRHCFKKYNPNYLRLFPFYLTASWLALLPLWIPFLFQFKILFQLIFNFIELIIFFVFFGLVLYDKRYLKKIILIPLIITSICLADLLVNKSYKNYSLYVIADLLPISILTLLYFKQVLTREPTKDLFHEPAFWISCGSLIYFLGIIPFFIFEYMFSRKILSVSKIYIFELYCINYVLFTTMTFLLIKSFTCRKKAFILK
jgi:hypothetical protein